MHQVTRYLSLDTVQKSKHSEDMLKLYAGNGNHKQ